MLLSIVFFIYPALLPSQGIAASVKPAGGLFGGTAFTDDKKRSPSCGDGKDVNADHDCGNNDKDKKDKEKKDTEKKDK
jgi:hypothetical protein